MNRWILLPLALLALPAFGQTIYKCPGPDGKSSYQQMPCPQGSLMAVQDNGSGSGADADAGLRPGEQQALEEFRQRHEAAKQAAAKQAAATQPPASPYARSPAYDGLERIIRESDATIRSLNRQLGRRR